MLIYAILGYDTFVIEFCDVPMVLDICRVHSLAYDQFEVMPNDAVGFRMRHSTAKMLMHEASLCGMDITPVKSGGLPLYLGEFFLRPGLYVGLFLALCLLILSTSVVWDIRVSGNVMLSDREIKESLAASGFSVGSRLWGFRADVLQNQVLMRDKRVAWISVNMKGTVAYVEVREAVYHEVEDTDTPTHIVASMDGQIVRVELRRGNVRVKAGQWVHEGELLVSGVYDSDVLGLRLTHAQAKVYAKTVEHMVIEIPLLHMERVPLQGDDAIWVEKSLIFFEKTVKFSNKTRNEGVLCDIIKRKSTPLACWGVNLPISFEQVWHLPYTWEEATYTYAEAEALAYLALSRRILAIQGGAEVLSKTITTARTPTAFVLECELECVRDIAREVGIA